MLDIIAISESKLNDDLKVDITIKGHPLTSTNTEAKKGGTSRHDLLKKINRKTPNLLTPLIMNPTKINTNNNALIDNIFSNQYHPDIIK